MKNIVVVGIFDQMKNCPQIYVKLLAYFCYFIKQKWLMALSCLFPYPRPLRNVWHPIHFHHIWQIMITVNVSNLWKFSATYFKAWKFCVATDFRRYATSVYVKINSLEISIEMKSLVILERGNTDFPLFVIT